MQSFVVGGYVPGTNTQFTFQQWLNISAILLVLILIIVMAFKHYYKKSATIDHQTFEAKDAYQLHNRSH